MLCIEVIFFPQDRDKQGSRVCFLVWFSKLEIVPLGWACVCTSAVADEQRLDSVINVFFTLRDNGNDADVPVMNYRVCKIMRNNLG